MPDLPEPPKHYQSFVSRFPKLAEAWELIGKEGHAGPLDERTARLVKLGLAIGSGQVGSVHASVRKAVALGVSREEVDQVLALAAGTIGLPQVAAAFSWVAEELERGPK